MNLLARLAKELKALMDTPSPEDTALQVANTPSQDGPGVMPPWGTDEEIDDPDRLAFYEEQRYLDRTKGAAKKSWMDY